MYEGVGLEEGPGVPPLFLMAALRLNPAEAAWDRFGELVRRGYSKPHFSPADGAAVLPRFGPAG